MFVNTSMSGNERKLPISQETFMGMEEVPSEIDRRIRGLLEQKTRLPSSLTSGRKLFNLEISKVDNPCCDIYNAFQEMNAIPAVVAQSVDDSRFFISVPISASIYHIEGTHFFMHSGLIS